MDREKLQERFNIYTKLTTGRIKKLLFDYEIKKKECEECKIPDFYNNKPLALQLHHINGNNKDNNIENLQILCPNCHSQTQTFRSKKKITEQDIINACNDSVSISEVVRKLNRYPSGHLYKMIEKVIITNDLPLKKYNYSNSSQNAKSSEGLFKKKNKPKKEPVLISCVFCENQFQQKGKNKFCSKKCQYESQIKYPIDEKEAIELVKEMGWTSAAKKLNINTKCPGNNLKLIIKRYIKANNLGIDIYQISAFSNLNRYK
jgi:Zn finger protein HypA/HybF involved in hydrogenase expression